MSYLENSNATNKAVTIAIVTVLEAAVILGIAAGLAVNFKRDDVTILQSKNIRLPEPQPTPKELSKSHETRKVQIDRTFTPTLPHVEEPPAPTPTFAPGPMPTFTIDKLPEPQPPLPPPTTFTPRNSEPLGNPNDWVTSDDYPSRDLREGNEGLTRYQLTIGTNGRVTACRIISSSGSTSLDDQACNRLSRRAHFKPATDSMGTKIVSIFSGKIRWEIPKGL